MMCTFLVGKDDGAASSGSTGYRARYPVGIPGILFTRR